MANQLARKGNPSGILRVLLRLPIWLYRAHLGWLLGHRFLMLTHTGRKSGEPRRVILEVVKFDLETHTSVVASGWGEQSNWFRNVQKTPDVLVHIAGRQLKATAMRLSEAEAEQALLDYARHHPLAFRELSKLMIGRALHETVEDCHLMAQVIPLVALQPNKE